MNIPTPLIAAIQQVVDFAIKLNPQVQATLNEIDQKVIQMHVRGLEIDIFLMIADGGVEVSGLFDGEIDTVVSGTPLALASLSRDMTGMFKGDIHISGDMAVGRSVKRVFAELDIEWEEQLSHFIGGTAAHQLGSVHRELSNLFSRTATNFKENTSEYLTEESDLLVTRYELQRYLDDVDDIRADTDRLIVRVSLLDSKASGECE